MGAKIMQIADNTKYKTKNYVFFVEISAIKTQKKEDFVLYVEILLFLYNREKQPISEQSQDWYHPLNYFNLSSK